MTTTIRGDGIAAACCAHLLRQAGLPVSWERMDRPRLPAILLTGAALSLLGDVFGPMERLSEWHRIRRRVVAWGSSPPVTMPHAAVVVSERVLLDTITANLAVDGHRPSGKAWTILASAPLPVGTEEHHFGHRRAAAVAVTLRDRVDSTACWIEAVEAGWLFLVPNGPHTGFLLAVGGEPEGLLAESTLVALRIEQLGAPAGVFSAHPRLRWPLFGPGWLACGGAAMAFDPLCGDGTAQAIREAILASAVIQAITKGEDEGRVLAHYQARMAAGLSRHLLLCEEFYRTGAPGTWWKTEWQRTRTGAEWCAKQVGELERFRYQLNGFALNPVS